MTNFEKQQTVEAIKTIVKARWFYVLAISLGAVIIKLFFPNVSLASNAIILIVVAAIFLINFIFWLYIRRPLEKINEKALRFIKFSQVLLEQLSLATLVYFSGATNKILIMMFAVPIIVGASIYTLKGIILSTLSTMLIYSGLVAMEYFGGLPYPFSLEPGKTLSTPLKGEFYFASLQLIYFNSYIIATFFYAAFLSILSKRREARLVNQRNELTEKTDLLTKQTQNLQIQTKKLQSTKMDLQGEKNKVEAVIENLTDGLIMLDDENKIISINQIAKRFFNIVDDKELINKKVEQIRTPEFQKMSQLLNFKRGQIEREEIVLSKHLNKILEISTAVINEPDNNFIGKIIILHDVTREKAIDKMKSEFVSITAHQLRTPLTAIKWVFKTILDKDLGKISPEQEEILSKGYVSNERVILLINDLLDVARIEEGRFIYQYSKIPFIDLLANVLKNFTVLIKEKKIKVNIERSENTNPVIKADKEKMEMALFNLVENALLYTPNHGSVDIVISADPANKKMNLSIKDTGIGIPKENYERIFSKFFRGESAIKIQTEGSGLGLFIVKNIIESHGGKIWFESDEGKGTIFYVDLPLTDK